MELGQAAGEDAQIEGAIGDVAVSRDREAVRRVAVDLDRQMPVNAAEPDRQRAHAVRSRGQRAAALHGDRAADGAGAAEGCAAGDRDGRSGGQAAVDQQRAAADGGRAGVGVRAGKDLGAAAGLGEISRREIVRQHAGERAAAVVHAEGETGVSRAIKAGLDRSRAGERVHAHVGFHAAEDRAGGHIQVGQVGGPVFVGVAATGECAGLHIEQAAAAEVESGDAGAPAEFARAGLAQGAAPGERGAARVARAAGHIQIEHGPAFGLEGRTLPGVLQRQRALVDRGGAGKLFAADRVSVPTPFLISPAEPATGEPMVALTPEAAVRVGAMPLRVSVAALQRVAGGVELETVGIDRAG